MDPTEDVLSQQMERGNLGNGDRSDETESNAIREPLAYQAAERYKQLLSQRPDKKKQIRQVVDYEADALQADYDAPYEVFGKYAYFMGHSDTDELGPCDNYVSASGKQVLCRARLKGAHNRRTGAKEIQQPCFSKTEQVINFDSICSRDGHAIRSFEALRVFPYGETGALLALTHRGQDSRLYVSFIGCNKEGKKGTSSGTVHKEKSAMTPIIYPSRLAGIGELHFMGHGNERDRHVARLFYTLVDDRERAWQVRRCYFHLGKGVITNDIAVYTEDDPSRYVSLYKSKDQKMLFIAVVTHKGTSSVRCIRNNSKLYLLPTLGSHKSILEHRRCHIYCVHNRTEEVDPWWGYQRIVGTEGTDICGNQFYPEVVASRICDRRLVPVRRRGTQTKTDESSSELFTSSEAQWSTVTKIANAVVSDLDMMHRALLLYCYRPPSHPRIVALSFGERYSKKRPRLGSRETTKIHEIAVPLEVGVIEPLPNSNFRSSTVSVFLNAPGTRDIRFNMDLEKLLAPGEDTNVHSSVRKPGVPSGSQDGSTLATGTLGPSKASDSMQQAYRVDKEHKRQEDKNGNTRSFVAMVDSRDGSCRIPVTLVARGPRGRTGAGLAGFINTGNKCAVYVYGAYGERLQVNNDLEHNVLLSLGYTLCFAHVRGGGELGPRWHSEASLNKKGKGFLDLVDVLEFLLARDICKRNDVAVISTSAGGVIAGCLFNMRPDLCSCVVLKLPFLGVLNSLRNGTASLSQLEHEEFGKPEDPHMDHLYSYDPLSNPMLQDYRKPGLVIQCNEEDPRAPWEQCCKFISFNCLPGSRSYLRVSPGIHMDGRDFNERLELITERVRIMEALLE